MEPGDETEGPGARWHWVAVLVASAVVVAWGLIIYALVPDRPRAWDFDALPDVPAQSIYSSQPTPPPGAAPPPQIAPLPEARPWKRPGAGEGKPAAAEKPGAAPAPGDARKPEGAP